MVRVRAVNRRVRRWLLLMAGLVLVAGEALAQDDLFERTAKKHDLSAELLRSIALVESNMHPWAVNINLEGFRPESPWQAVQLIQRVQRRPWLLKVFYKDTNHRLFFRSGRDAQFALLQLRARARFLDAEVPQQWEIRKLDVRSVDIGLMQINWKFHGEHFDSMQALFDPATNLDYAARFLKSLLKEHGDLEQAVAHYHSNTEEFQNRYLQAFRQVYEKQLGEARSG